MGDLPATGKSEDAAAKRKDLAVSFFRGIYTGDPSVVDQIAAPDIVVSYPIFGDIFKTPAIRGRDAVVLFWEFQAQSSNPANSSNAESSKQAWGGITLYRFNESNQIMLELGEESTPGPVARISVRDYYF